MENVTRGLSIWQKKILYDAGKQSCQCQCRRKQAQDNQPMSVLANWEGVAPMGGDARTMQSKRELRWARGHTEMIADTVFASAHAEQVRHVSGWNVSKRKPSKWTKREKTYTVVIYIYLYLYLYIKSVASIFRLGLSNMLDRRRM